MSLPAASTNGPPAATEPAPPGASLLGGSLVLFVATNLANGLHFAFHLVMARLLGPADYGVMAAIFAAVYVFSVAPESAQTVVARHAARARSHGELRARLSTDARAGARLTIALVALWSIASLALAWFLKASPSIFALFGIGIAAVVWLCGARGALLGLRRFVGFGASQLLEAGGRLVVGAAAVSLGWGLYGVGAAVSISFVLALGGAALALRDVLRAPPAEGPPDVEAAPGYGVAVLVATGTLIAFYSLDVVLARALLPATAAGQYSLAALIGKGAVLGTLPLARAMFPFAARAGRSGGSARVLAATLGLLAICLVPALAVVALWPGPLTRLAGGAGYEGAAAILLPVAAAFCLMAVSQTLVTFRLAAGNPRFAAWLVLSLAGEAALLAACGGSLATYALGVLAAHAGFLLIAALFAWAGPRGGAP